MDCPRCGGSLARFSLAERDGDPAAIVCERCGYVGVPADHRPDPPESESWETAIRRFRESSAREASGEAGREETIDLPIGGSTYRVPAAIVERFERRTDKQRRVIRELLREADPTDPARTWTVIADAAGVHRSYASEVASEYADLVVAIREEAVAGGDGVDDPPGE